MARSVRLNETSALPFSWPVPIITSTIPATTTTATTTKAPAPPNTTPAPTSAAPSPSPPNSKHSDIRSTIDANVDNNNFATTKPSIHHQRQLENQMDQHNNHSRQPSSPANSPPSPMRFKEKSVVIHRDENGFGLRVGGQNPVFVDFVHENGAAWKAGVRKDDNIIKINGTLVRSFDHQRVVHMIQNCTPFVNLTLHSPDTVVDIADEKQQLPQQQPQPTQATNSALATGDGSLLLSNNATPGDPNFMSHYSFAQHLQQQQQHPHHHSASSNTDWLLNIGEDLFQDGLHQQQSNQSQQEVTLANEAQSPPPTTSGISKLIVSGPSPLNIGSTKPKLRQHYRNQASPRDNPYYYYRTAPENSTLSDETSCNSVSSSLLGHNKNASLRSNSSIVRSRSSSKLSTRSKPGKYKAKNLRSRLVEDLRSLTITNSQTTPSSLSTLPSSSDLSDCDDQDSSQIDCLSLNTSRSSASLSGFAAQLAANNSNNNNPTGAQQPSNESSFEGTLVEGANSVPVKTESMSRRMEIIRELIETEKHHTERLRQLNDLLYKPIKAEGLIPADQLKMVFSCHKTLFKIHRQIYKILLAAQLTVNNNHPDCHQANEPLIGRALVEIFEGELGRELDRASCTFCACQSTNTELLNRFTRKDTRAGEFLAQVATQQMLGRLGIKDLLASCFQRLTKYPLLLENLLKATASKSTNTDSANDAWAHERLCISRALYQSRQILIHVNEAVKRAISQTKLRDIWKKTEKSPSLPVINIETQQMLHEGPLTLRLARRTFEVYVLLLSQYLVILTREGQDKFKLKNFTADFKTTTVFSPIFNIDEHLAIRDTATDENGFYLLCKEKKNSRIYEFASQSPSERAKWKEKIHMAQLYNLQCLSLLPPTPPAPSNTPLSTQTAAAAAATTATTAATATPTATTTAAATATATATSGGGGARAVAE